MSDPSAAQKRWARVRWARRGSQAVFLLLFLWLIAVTASLAGRGFDAAAAARVPYPVEAFLDIDPLAATLVLLATGTVPATMLFSLAVLASALLLGRAFCGWVCPMGTMNHLTAGIGSRLRGKRRLRANDTRPYQKIKYVLLTALLASALFGSAIGGLFDPICLATRGVALTFLPWIHWAVDSLLSLAFESRIAAVRQAADGLYEGVGVILPGHHGAIVAGGALLSVLFIAVLVANRFIPRFWCRGLCPLGAMLGVAARAGILDLVKDAAACDGCDKCRLHCSGAASPKPGDRWQRAECDLCLNCVADCPQDALTLGLAGRKSDERSWPDVRRRAVIAGAVAGAALVPTLRTGSLGSPRGRPDPACIRPPGAHGEQEFLARCVRCGQCMKICPNNALHPALDEAGVEGLWTPVLVARIGYCEPTCTLCTQVCPTGAIRRVSEARKLGAEGQEMVRLGTAFFDRGRCLPWAMGTSCMVCEEFCPASPKAIWTREEEVELHGRKVKVKRPYVDPARCNGCGACEYICPVHDKAAIRITAVGESRDPEHELLLERPSTKAS